ncbi:hypothetical protein LTS10_008551 [Elasticomyces elasticus]|nr:hypothetical protein LTS10_008551 [Elasticomyces elasticus]
MNETKAASISGLREQIKGTKDVSQLPMLTNRQNTANAVLLFPSLVTKYRKLGLIKSSVHVPAADTFDIVAVILDREFWHAFITYTTDHGVKRAVQSKRRTA